MKNLRIGIVGLGANTRLRHVPGLRQCENVEIVGVVNRSPLSTEAAANEFGIPKTYPRWEDLVRDDDIDAVVIGTWPYLHCPITLAALEQGKHVLTEARMAMNAEEARQMHRASQQHPDLVTQIVPSPLGLAGDHVIRELVDDGFIGPLREIAVLGTNSTYADETTPLHWRQDAQFSGVNMLSLGILHETLIRWTPDPVRVSAQTHLFTTHRPTQESAAIHEATSPDSVHVLAEFPDGVRGIYHFSGAIHFGPPPRIHLYGAEGTIKYLFTSDDKVLAGRRGDSELREIQIPAQKRGRWRVEEEFVNAIRGEEAVKFTDFATGVRYMQFTQAVAQSAGSGRSVPLSEV